MQTRPLLFRLLPSFCGVALYALCAALWESRPAAGAALLRWYDFMAKTAPYGDLGAVLQAGVCWRQGVDVYRPSACMDGGVYNYAPLLLRGAGLGLGPAQLVWGGVLVGGLFLAACALLPPPRGKGALTLRCLAVCSGTVAFALKSANFDAVLFVLCLLAVRLLLAPLPWRLPGYALFALGGALKFYPAALLVLALRERRELCAALAGAGLVAAALYLGRYGAGVATALAMLPAGLPFDGIFGAINVPFGLVLLRFLPVPSLLPTAPQFLAAVSVPHVAAYVALASKGLVLAGLLSGAQLRGRFDSARRALPAPERLYLAAGAGLTAFCFYAAQNIEYRAVYLLFTLPGLGLMGRAGHVLILVELALLWDGALRHLAAATGLFGLEILLWAVKEYAWWFVVVRLTALVFGEGRDAVRVLAGRGAALAPVPGAAS